MELGNRIKLRRKMLNMTQDELALKLGYKSGSSINKIELGLADIPQSKIKLFAKTLQTSPSYLINWNDDSGVPIFDYQSELRNRKSFTEARNTQSMVLMFDNSTSDLDVTLDNKKISHIPLNEVTEVLQKYLESDNHKNVRVLLDVSKKDIEAIATLFRTNIKVIE
ncbi:MAG: helix-turn-helix transcriptional regulator [Bacteroidaceae bacterium]|nr:helix-turn-helix transcriptional regulator [Bacteroidaceae bacterium]